MTTIAIICILAILSLGGPGRTLYPEGQFVVLKRASHRKNKVVSNPCISTHQESKAKFIHLLPAALVSKDPHPYRGTMIFETMKELFEKLPAPESRLFQILGFRGINNKYNTGECASNLPKSSQQSWKSQ